MKLYSFNLDPKATMKAMKKAKHEGTNLSVLIRQFIAKYAKNFKDEEEE